jgi:hypothetical protein
MMEGPPYPKAQPNASRRDACRRKAASRVPRCPSCRSKLLDPYNVALGVLNPLDTGQGLRNHDLSARDLATAINDWQIEKWTSKDIAPERLDRRRQ